MSEQAPAPSETADPAHPDGVPAAVPDGAPVLEETPAEGIADGGEKGGDGNAAGGLIVASPSLVDPTVDRSQPAGFPEGTMLRNPDGAMERIVHTIEDLFDEVGNKIGEAVRFHKEPVAEDDVQQAAEAQA